MAWMLTGSRDEYLTVAGGFLRSRPVHNTIQLVALDALEARGPSAFGDIAPLFGWWRASAGPVTAALLHTPPFPVLLTRLPAHAAGDLAEALAGCGRQLPGVNAEQGDAGAFAAAWSGLTGAGWREFRRSRLFRLEQLTPPDPFPPGAARVATAADRGLLESWLAAFRQELADLGGPGAGMIEDRISHGGLTLWEADGAPVSLAGCSRPAEGVVRLGPVYTPPEHRGRGYGGAVTAAVSQAALGAGAAHVVLFTDLANRTSNALYSRLGYRPVEDRLVLQFRPHDPA
ncbi:MAG TPA: GNAT family N-acetyltransferase [Streptosporangiaceae bacterium]|nr:GNAT family N-acetyltransferase [Streptosporangiaceae bacterium]